jgi:hypothetical protein
LQNFEAFRDTGPPDAKQFRQHSMSKGYLVVGERASRDEQPTGKPLFQTMIRIARSRLGSLRQHDRQVSFNDGAQFGQRLQHPAEVARLDPQRCACHLNGSSVQGGGIAREQDRSANYSLGSDEPNFDEFVTSNSRSDGDKPLFDKVNIVHRHSVVMQDLPGLKLDAFAVPENARQLIRWNKAKELVTDRRDHSLFQWLRTAMLCSKGLVRARGDLSWAAPCGVPIERRPARFISTKVWESIYCGIDLKYESVPFMATI